jgi:hypothetical protein
MHHLGKVFRGEKLPKVTGMCGMDLFLDVGLSGENDDGDRLQFRVAVPFPEKHPAACNGHYQIEQDAGRMP